MAPGPGCVRCCIPCLCFLCATGSQVDGQLWDLARPLEGDCQLELFNFETDEGRDTFWHSSAHILGQVPRLPPARVHLDGGGQVPALCAEGLSDRKCGSWSSLRPCSACSPFNPCVAPSRPCAPAGCAVPSTLLWFPVVLVPLRCVQSLEMEYKCKLCIGPCTTRGEGFFYDAFYDGLSLSEDHFKKIEAGATKAAKVQGPGQAKASRALVRGVRDRSGKASLDAGGHSPGSPC